MAALVYQCIKNVLSEIQNLALPQNSVLWFGCCCYHHLCGLDVGRQSSTDIMLGISERYTSINEKSVGSVARAQE